MDSDLDGHEVSNIIEALGKNDDLREEWKTYHLIGDTLRRSSRLSMNMSSSVNQKLKIEPTILSPNPSDIAKKLKRKIFAFSMAASVVAMVSSWLIMHNNTYESQQTLVATKHPNRDNHLTVTPVMVSSPASVHNYPHPPVEINNYLFVHREFSPGITMRGQITNVHDVSEYHERYGR